MLIILILLLTFFTLVYSCRFSPELENKNGVHTVHKMIYDNKSGLVFSILNKGDLMLEKLVGMNPIEKVC